MYFQSIPLVALNVLPLLLARATAIALASLYSTHTHGGNRGYSPLVMTIITVFFYYRLAPNAD